MCHSPHLIFRLLCRVFFAALLVFDPAFHAHATPLFEPVQALVRGPEKPDAKLILASDGNFYGTTAEGGSSGKGTVFMMTPAGTLTILVSFTGDNGSNPGAGLVQGSDGNFYGTTVNGGSGGKGTVFKMTPAGTLTTLVNFTGANGSTPIGGLIQGSDGNFYGTTNGGGSGGGWGTVFKMTNSGTLTTLANFTTTNGSSPQAALIQGSDGNFYGTTWSGGSNSLGTVFKMTGSGTLTTLVNFTSSNGSSPVSALVQASDGNFYGTTPGGGYGYGTVFKMTSSGTLTTLVKFYSNSGGGNPGSGLVRGNDGNFYGTTSYGGSGSFGTVFKMTSTGTLTTLVNFNGTNGRSPSAELIQSSDGNFYGTTYGDNSDSGTVFKMTSSGTLTTLVHFTKDHGSPQAPLVQGSDGHFYGTAYSGGSMGYGAVFKMTSNGTLTTLVNFTSINGRGPRAALVQGSDGNFYGTTSLGGSGGTGYGTVFKMTSSGTLTTLVHFTGANGSYPYAALVQGSNGNFYGTTYSGGSSNRGTVFKMTSSGTLTTLVNFTGDNGNNPAAALVEGIDGNFYGTTSGGGNYGSTVFKMTPTGTLTTLNEFTGLGVGYAPYAALVQGTDGNFYGTTNGGGSGGGYGTVFKMTSSGTLITLANFTGANGSSPYAALVQGSDGNFYGTTYSGGGSSSQGTVFKMTSSGTLTTLVHFTGANGSYPNAGLIRGNDGNLYGTTSYGGTAPDGRPAGGGQIFRLRMGPVITSRPQATVATTSVSLDGTVNPGGYETALSFEYGTDPTLTSYDTVTAGTLPPTTADTPVQASISGLQSVTPYYFRIVASNVENTVPQTGSILSFTTLDTYAFWASSRFSSEQLADPLVSGPNGDPDKDGICNLLECAFNMLPLSAGNEVLTVNSGVRGLPLIRATDGSGSRLFSIQYLRRKTSASAGLTYTPQFSSSLNGGWSAATGTETAVSIDSEWERVTIEEDASGHEKRFGRVMVTGGN